MTARVIAVDANAYFSRPGPRVVEGVELLEGLFQGTGETDIAGSRAAPTNATSMRITSSTGRTVGTPSSRTS